MTDTALSIATAALRTIAGCGLDAAGMARTAAIALSAIEGLEERHPLDRFKASLPEGQEWLPGPHSD